MTRIEPLAVIFGLAVILVTFLPEEPVARATATCSSFDVRELCCPGACAARHLPGSRENAILRQCMVGLGCAPSETDGATTFQHCACK